MLCRNQLIFQAQTDGIINFNWNYPQMKNNYEAFTLQDKEKSKWLHNEGFIVDDKKFKLINFSLLFNNKITNKGFEIKKGDIIKMPLSGKKELVNDIIKGFIKQDSFNLYDCSFKMTNVEQDRSFNFKKQMLYKVVTPIVESIYDNGQKYLSVYDNRYYNALAQNLKRKYQAVYGKKYEGELYFDIENILKAKEKVIHNIKDKGIIKGYGNFELWIEADIDMQKIAYYCGMGQNSSLGAGFLTYITGRRG
jgi:CRISPR-associated endoribonuclease Cas6